MKEKKFPNSSTPDELPLNVGILGGGMTCKFFLELLRSGAFRYLHINVVGVCDIDPEAEGLRLAQSMGIYTTENLSDLFEKKDLDFIIELSNKNEVLLDLVRTRPKGVGIIEHNTVRFLRHLSTFYERLKFAEEQLILEKMSSDFLIQQSSMAIVVLNTDFSISDANEAYLKNVDLPRDEVKGAYCYKISHGLNEPCAVTNPALKCPMIETLRTGKSAHVIHELESTSKQRHYSNIVTYPLKNQDGEIVKIIEIWHDITKEISSRLEKRVKELKADLNKIVQEDRLISLGKLATSCVHEINNPIQGLLTFTDLMQNIVDQGIPSEEDLKNFRKHLTLMSHELERCGNIVSSLLSFSRTSSTGHKHADLNDILNEIIKLTNHKMELQNIRLNTCLHNGPLMIQGDVNQLQQCFLNLILNAIEAMPLGGQLEIISKLEKEQNTARIEIKDTGPGIPDDNMEHIFDPFFTTKEEGEGTGLGLSIVYGIVKNHKGDIEVNSQVGKGCSFVLAFPIP